MSKYAIKTALDVRNGDIIVNAGYRCRVSDVQLMDIDGEPVARYTLHSEPDDVHKLPLPRGFDGMRSGGNRLAAVAIQF